MSHAKRVPLILAAVALVYTASMLIVGSAAFAAKPSVIAAGVAFDLTVTASFVVWWFGVRHGWPWWTVAATFAAGLLAARTILPATPVVTILAGAWVLVEVALAVVLTTRLRRIIRAVRAFRGPGPVAALEAGLVVGGVPRKLVGILATDVAVFVYGIGGWFRRAPRTGFTMHRLKSWSAIIGVLLFLTVVETAALHLVISHWNVIAAWIITALSIYGGLWLAADLHAMRLHPLRVERDAIVVSIGIRWRFTIPRDAIVSVEPVDARPDGALNASVVEPNILVTLDRPIEARTLLGITRRADRIALTVDEPERFLATFR